SHAGEEPYRLAIALQLATGNFGLLGGSTGSIMHRLPSAQVGTLPDLGRDDSPRVAVNRWPDAILEGQSRGYPSDIAAADVAGANFLNQGADIRKSIRAFEALEFSVCHELFLTPTARYCDLVLPVASSLEKEDIGIPWAGNYLLYKRAAFPTAGKSRSDYDIFRELSERMGFGEAFSEGRNEAAWLERFLDQSEIGDREAFKESGVYFGADQERVGLSDFAADPRAHPLGTPSGKVELRSEALERETGLPALPGWRVSPPDPPFPLSLITPKAARRTHSQGGWEAIESGDGKPFVLLNPEDASARKLAEGGLARVTSRNGSLIIPVSISLDLMQGTVVIHEGSWAELPPTGTYGRGSSNFLTDTIGSPVSLACVMHSVGVAVEKA
ncbi:MAG: molybdopterin dinucleotide binding domain-containing protein, partial [Spirochaetota bacterium]